jgi:integrase
MALELADLHWRAAEIVVRGKGRQRDHVPLLADVEEPWRSTSAKTVGRVRRDGAFGGCCPRASACRVRVPSTTSSDVRCTGKGRKTRATPLRPDVATVLADWLAHQPGAPPDPVFPSARGSRLSADALQRLVTRHTITARRACPTLTEKVVTPHTLRHAAAMALLQRGVDLSVIALWLGHESTETTEVYLHADMRLKERALAHATPSAVIPARYRAPDL